MSRPSPVPVSVAFERMVRLAHEHGTPALASGASVRPCAECGELARPDERAPAFAEGGRATVVCLDCAFRRGVHTGMVWS